MDRIKHGQDGTTKLGRVQRLNHRHLFRGQDWLLHKQSRRAFFIGVHDIGHVAAHDDSRSHDAFPDAVYRRISDLGKVLLKIII